MNFPAARKGRGGTILVGFTRALNFASPGVYYPNQSETPAIHAPRGRRGGKESMNSLAAARVTVPGGTKRGVMRGMARLSWLLPAISLFLATACHSLLLPLPAAAAGEPASEVTLRIENDLLSRTDAGYTAGVSLSYTRNDSGLLGWVWESLGADQGRPYSSYELAQLIFTPTDLGRSPPDPRDRPYAGILYAGLTTGRQTDASLKSLKLLVGVVGPSSLGEAGQENIHLLLEQVSPRGWNYQLDDEPLLDLIYEQRHRFRLAGRDDGVAAELIPIGTAMVGNYLTKARAEGQLRLGYRLQDDFGETSIRGLGASPVPGNGTAAGEGGLYVFTGGGVDMVARDITLDGNSNRSGPSVDKNAFVSFVTAGLVYRSGSFRGSFSYFFRGREFEGQNGGEKYGSLALTRLF